MKQRLKMPSTVPRRSSQSPARLSASHTATGRGSQMAHHLLTLARRGQTCPDVTERQEYWGGGGLPALFGRRCLTTAVAPPPGHRGRVNRKEPRMVTSGMPSFPSAESRAALHIHIKHSLPQQPHPSQSHQSPLPTAGAGAPPASSGWSSCPGPGTNSLPAVYPGTQIPQ